MTHWSIPLISSTSWTPSNLTILLLSHPNPSSNMTTQTNISGYLNVHKPIGITSMETVRRLKQSLPKKTKVGHAGTLDPLAVGVLPICIGAATRLMEYAVSGTKVYIADLKLGYTSDTYDAEGTITPLDPSMTIHQSDIQQVLKLYIGRIQQIPPMYSALKRNGQRLYDLARAGLEISRPPRPVDIFAIELLDYSYPSLRLSVTCGSGVYIRSLASDIGDSLACGAYLTALTRARSGSFHLSDAILLSDLHQQDWDYIKPLLKPIDFTLQDLPISQFTDDQSTRLIQGQTITSHSEGNLSHLTDYRAYDGDLNFFGITRLIDSVWHPIKMFSKL
ncbi:MAG: tRNA pseudouridine(55) synthase TruB [Dehalococcoidia bacterium]|nr:tRNA pseudouridine(55) synthase TruB [Dehalococcoidia bacterium]